MNVYFVIIKLIFNSVTICKESTMCTVFLIILTHFKSNGGCTTFGYRLEVYDGYFEPISEQCVDQSALGTMT